MERREIRRQNASLFVSLESVAIWFWKGTPQIESAFAGYEPYPLALLPRVFWARRLCHGIAGGYICAFRDRKAYPRRTKSNQRFPESNGGLDLGNSVALRQLLFPPRSGGERTFCGRSQGRSFGIDPVHTYEDPRHHSGSLAGADSPFLGCGCRPARAARVRAELHHGSNSHRVQTATIRLARCDLQAVGAYFRRRAYQ